MQMVNAQICRSRLQSVFTIGLTSNRLLNGALLIYIVLILLITYSPMLQVLFHTASLPLQYWLILLPFMAAMLAIEELRKWRARKHCSTTQLA